MWVVSLCASFGQINVLCVTWESRFEISLTPNYALSKASSDLPERNASRTWVFPEIWHKKWQNLRVEHFVTLIDHPYRGSLYTSMCHITMWPGSQVHFHLAVIFEMQATWILTKYLQTEIHTILFRYIYTDRSLIHISFMWIFICSTNLLVCVSAWLIFWVQRNNLATILMVMQCKWQQMATTIIIIIKLKYFLAKRERGMGR